MFFGGIIDAKHGLTLAVAAVVAAMLLQVTTPCTSLVLLHLLSYCDSSTYVAFFIGVVLPSAWSSIGYAVLVVLPR